MSSIRVKTKITTMARAHGNKASGQVYNRHVSKLCQEQQLEDALHLVNFMVQHGFQVSIKTYACLLHTCSRMKALAEGKIVHTYIRTSRFESNIYLANILVDMYANCGSVLEAQQVFNIMHERNVFSWTAIISAYARQGQGEHAICLFHQMLSQDMVPDKILFIVILKACASMGALEQGKHFHAQVIKNGFESDVFVGNTLIDMYAKCGSIEEACHVFSKMHVRNVVSWNVMIAGYVQQGNGRKALTLFEQMQKEGVNPDVPTFLSILKVCGSLLSLQWGKVVHAHIIESGFDMNVCLGNTLIDMYAKCGSIEDAHKVFNKMPERNVISWTAMIAGYAHQGLGMKALSLFSQMQMTNMKPDKVMLIVILKACGELLALERGMQVHVQIVKCGFELDLFVGSTLIDMYSKCGSINDARQVFDKMHQRDVVAWNAMITGYVQQGYGKEALTLFEQMKQKGVKPDRVTFVSILKACGSLAALHQGKLIHAHVTEGGFDSDVFVQSMLVDMYAKCGNMEDARYVFSTIEDRDAVTWSAMITGYAQQGYIKEVLILLQQMQLKGVKPDYVTFISILNACGSWAALEWGKKIHAHIIKSGFMEDTSVANTLVAMYAKCGSIEAAYQVFNKMHERDIVSWNTIIAGYAQQGHAEEALELYGNMQHHQMKPDAVTFVSVLSACSHAGLVDDGCHHFNYMSHDHGISPTREHYTCMVDLLGRAGCLDEAQDLINKMPIRSNVVVWIALLGACRSHGNVVLGRCSFEQVLKLDPKCAVAYVLLSNIYAGVGNWVEVANIRKEMEEAGLKVSAG